MAESSPTFHFWALIMELEVLLLVFLTSLRSGNFGMYVQSMTRMAPAFFALDQQNYARWLTVHINDMGNINANESHEFQEGHFVVTKTGRPFSRIALDHAHEQNNAIVKGDGGAVGLTDNPSALRRWMISGPEVSRVIQEFETSLERDESDELSIHPEQSSTFQEAFCREVRKLTATIQEAGNPFSERCAEFITLHSKDIVCQAAHESMKHLMATGDQQFKVFIQD
jgi:hypothetical protein